MYTYKPLYFVLIQGRLMIDNFKAVCSGWILKSKEKGRERAVATTPEEELLNYDVYVGITNSNATVDWLLVSFGSNPTSSHVVCGFCIIENQIKSYKN